MGMSAAPVPPLWRNRKVQILGLLTGLCGSWVVYDRWRDARIKEKFESIAREHGSRHGDIKRLTLLLPRTPHKEDDKEGEEGKKGDELEREFKMQCKKHVIPLLTLAGIDYSYFAHSRMEEVYARWTNYFTKGKVVQEAALEGFVQPQEDAFLRHGVVCTSDEMFNQIVGLKEPAYNVYKVDASPTKGLLKRFIAFFDHSGERERVGQQVLELIEAVDQ
jgi:hypothetical protein